ncbi:exosortase A [Janthinobacterium sp. K2Li3]|nr:exosortase A [Janthinobacterium sp. K2C7]MBB5382624.1 exosortase A [Janthinobacterium sp. K2Li3]MBB5384609.1 exosortase A [Janthinobacterium sp. K2E3]
MSMTPDSVAAAARPVSLTPRVLLLAMLLAVLLLYHATFWTMLEIWSRSQTFAHGFLIVPISIWLAWRQRARLAVLPPQASLTGLLLLAGCGLAWLLANAANVQVVEQYAATAMLPACVWAILGWPAVRLLAFPLAYLFLAVPFGEVFIEPLIDFTASFTVAALQLTGIPVFRDGSNFYLPSGSWSVVEACSGLRYLIASLALGALFAHLNCHSRGRRLAVMAAALVVPIIANGVRAYLIVMLGHLSNMRLAVGIDHLVYGWLFFGLVALVLFWCATRWRERPLAAATATPTVASRPAASIRVLLASLAIAALWPGLAWLHRDEAAAAMPAAPLALAAPPGWQKLEAPPAWRAPVAGHPLQWLASYRQETGKVNLQLSWFARQAPDAELLTHQAQPYGETWSLLQHQKRTIKVGGRGLTVREAMLGHGGERMLVWRFYRQGGVTTANPVLVKLLLARGKLLGTRQDGADLIVSTAYDELAPPPRPQLQAFLQAALPMIEQRLQELPHER